MRGNLFVLFVVCWLTVDVNGQCGGSADIVIAIPASHQVPPYEFAAFENHLIDLLYHFKLSSSDINIGLIVYGGEAEAYAWPQPFKDRLKTNTRVTLMTQQRLKYNDVSAIKETKVSVALRMINNMLTGPPPGYRNMILRPDARKIGIIYTWGKANTTDEIEQVKLEAKKLKEHFRNIKMYALGANETGEEFESIGTDRCRLFSMGNFTHGLTSAVTYLADGVCSEIDPLVTVYPSCFPKHYGKASPIISSCDRPDYRGFADPNNCAYELFCGYTTEDKTQRRICAEGTLYSDTTKSCVHKEYSVCFKDVVNCPKGAHIYKLLPHPNDCGKFINCESGGLPIVQDCPATLYFDVTYGRCNETQYVECIKGERLF